MADLRENEEWRDIPGYETFYKISNKGRVMCLRNNRHTYLDTPKIKKPYKDEKGYYHVSLIKNCHEKRFAVHRLVAMAFIPNQDNLPEVNHKDENPSNNCVDNLEWCTRIYNVNYGTAIDRARKKKSKPVSQYSLDGKLIGVYPSQSCARKIIKAERIQKHIDGDTRYKTVQHSLWKSGEDQFNDGEDTVRFYINKRFAGELSSDIVEIVPTE